MKVRRLMSRILSLDATPARYLTGEKKKRYRGFFFYPMAYFNGCWLLHSMGGDEEVQSCDYRKSSRGGLRAELSSHYPGSRFRRTFSHGQWLMMKSIVLPNEFGIEVVTFVSSVSIYRLKVSSSFIPEWKLNVSVLQRSSFSWCREAGENPFRCWRQQYCYFGRSQSAVWNCSEVKGDANATEFTQMH